MDVWSDLVTYDDAPFEKPSVVMHDTEITGACGIFQEDRSASFCPADNTIYFPIRTYSNAPQGVEHSRYVADTVLGHEFGHYIQNYIGIRYGSIRQQVQVDESVQLDLNRREELQAQCFAGLTFTSLGASEQDKADIEKIHRRYVDNPPYESTHGTLAHYAGWMKNGLNSRNASVCNTFIASAEEVS
jgi:predicted metalloprotease